MRNSPTSAALGAMVLYLVVCPQSAFAGSIGFNGGVGWTANTNVGLPSFSSNSVVMTNDFQGNTSTSVWFDTTQTLGSFTTSFVYTATLGGLNPADGITLAFQDLGTSYLGSFGGGLGYAMPGKSAAIALNIYSGSPGGAPGTQFYTDGQTAAFSGAPYMSTLPVRLASSDQISVDLAYDSTAGTLNETLVDSVADTTFSHTYSGVNLSSTIGSSTAFVGFTGGTGTGSSTQTISDFQFTTTPEPSSLLLLGTGLLGLMAMVRRRKRLA